MNCLKPFIIIGAIACFSIYGSAEVTVNFDFNQIDDNLQFTDSTGYGLQGTLQYADQRVDDAPSGKADDYAVEFFGGDEIVIQDTNQVLNFDKDWTIEAWMKPSYEAERTDAYVIADYGSSEGGYSIQLVPQTDTVTFRAALTGVADVDSINTVVKGSQWQHIAVIYRRGESMTFYYNGKVVDTLAIQDVPLSAQNHELRIGAGSSDPLLYYAGLLDRLRFSDYALSPSDLDSTPNPDASKDISVVFNFDRFEDLSFTDDSGYGMQGVLITTDQIMTDSPSGKSGDTSLEFLGSEQVVISDPEGLLNYPNDWTAEVWIKPHPFDIGRTNVEVVYTYGVPGGHSLQLTIPDSNDNTKLGVRGTAVGVLDMPSEVTRLDIEQWQHLAVVFRSGESLTFYVNGQQTDILVQSNIRTQVSETLRLVLGSWPDAFDFSYTGLMDRLRMTNRALNVDELDSNPEGTTSVLDWAIY